MGHQQQHVFVGSRAHHRDSQWRVAGKLEGSAEFALSQHLQAQPLGALGQVRQVVLCPAGAKIRVHGRLGDSVVADRVGGTQYPMATGDGVDCVAQPGQIDVTGDAVGHTDVE
ncbi:Uncharacterised protein [Mycobacterium tuberculosis]|uniref:Uncharacterized protein n=1 Tax=Mycobacterium tuberculosis TaxID=1773 RepID=A0A0U0QZS4_MYCTX|nr:peptide synthetase [Mycobacterium tuberculosis]AUS51524.1 hypothetical protein CAB90_02665 [Mycobacterium tuberculosis]KFC55605.1 hypothetical protein FF22_02021 [Mycobacterium tuberculosis]CFA90866.1 Uncharacterised protein [Mycobacterium tuberculosis]CFE51760.1 Uncharacterised protein [Mycobacterium tuberculosis]